MQLALDPIRTGDWDEAETAALLGRANLAVVSGMMTTEGEDYSSLSSIRETGGLRPDRTWERNLRAAQENAELATRLGVELVTLHAGFIPHDRGAAEYGTIIDRVRRVAEVFSACGVRLGLETGQETAPDLLAALADIGHPGVGINFDPANMILYGMGDPVRALGDLSAHVVQMHVKDAVPSEVAGEWGAEVPAGDGAVDWAGVFSIVRDRLPTIDLVIEREAGDRRVDDVRQAAALVEAKAGPGRG